MNDGKKAVLAAVIADRMAFVYNRSPEDAARVAAACDERIDRSGNLLGWLREYAVLQRAATEGSARDGG